jgi:hypothetical protein
MRTAKRLREPNWLIVAAAPLALLLATAVGCKSDSGDKADTGKDNPLPSPDSSAMAEQSNLNKVFLRSAFEEQTRNGIVAESTVYPYHFRTNGPQLNELGEQQVRAIAAGYRGNELRVNVPRGDTVDELYQLRVETIRKYFADAGYGSERITVTRGVPGGRGISSDFAIRLFDTETTDVSQSSNWSDSRTSPSRSTGGSSSQGGR